MAGVRHVNVFQVSSGRETGDSRLVFGQVVPGRPLCKNEEGALLLEDVVEMITSTVHLRAIHRVLTEHLTQLDSGEPPTQLASWEPASGDLN